MSCRNLCGFSTNHRAEDVEKLTLRMKDGLGSTKYKPLHYEQLQHTIDAKRLACADTLQKFFLPNKLVGVRGLDGLVSKLSNYEFSGGKTLFQIQKTQHVARRAREGTLLRQHRQQWVWEQAKLTKAGENAEAELQSFLENNEDFFISQMCDYEEILDREREDFREATVTPIWQLKEDMQFRLAGMRQVTTQHPSLISDCDAAMQEVHSVKEQQRAIVERLHSEYESLEQEIFALGIEECSSFVQDMWRDLKQVPDEILNAQCPYSDLKASLIQEFHAISEKYESKLLNIRECLQEIGRCCGWPEQDHMVYQMVWSQYSQDLTNHRTLSMDMLQRLLPHRTRQELKEHEQSWDRYRFALAHQRAALHSWQQERTGLLNKCLAILQEALVAHEEEQIQHSQQILQQAISIQLKEKLQQWRAQQEEVARLEAAVESRRREEEEERRRREGEREKVQRAVQRERVKQFNSDKQRRRAEQEKKDLQRLEDLRAQMIEQAERDKERVQFREALLLQRKRDRQTQALLRQEEEEEKRGHLEALRSQVAVVAQADPERMMGDTKAWQSRHQTGEEFVLQKPLYQLNSFTDKQIVADPRVRVEKALREAGFHSSPYAREVLSAIPPPRLPRRDTESTVFKT